MQNVMSLISQDSSSSDEPSSSESYQSYSHPLSAPSVSSTDSYSTPPYSPIDNSTSEITSLCPSHSVIASTLETTPTPIVNSQWFGFKIVGDNLDQYVKPRFMRSDRLSMSVHYFNSYCVHDIIPLFERY